MAAIGEGVGLSPGLQTVVPDRAGEIMNLLAKRQDKIDEIQAQKEAEARKNKEKIQDLNLSVGDNINPNQFVPAYMPQVEAAINKFYAETLDLKQKDRSTDDFGAKSAQMRLDLQKSIAPLMQGSQGWLALDNAYRTNPDSLYDDQKALAQAYESSNSSLSDLSSAVNKIQSSYGNSGNYTFNPDNGSLVLSNGYANTNFDALAETATKNEKPNTFQFDIADPNKKFGDIQQVTGKETFAPETAGKYAAMTAQTYGVGTPQFKDWVQQTGGLKNTKYRSDTDPLSVDYRKMIPDYQKYLQSVYQNTLQGKEKPFLKAYNTFTGEEKAALQYQRDAMLFQQRLTAKDFNATTALGEINKVESDIASTIARGGNLMYEGKTYTAPELTQIQSSLTTAKTNLKNLVNDHLQNKIDDDTYTQKTNQILYDLAAAGVDVTQTKAQSGTESQESKVKKWGGY